MAASASATCMPALRGLPLLIGRARVALDRDEGTPDDDFDGAATVTRRGFGFDDLDRPAAADCRRVRARCR